MEDNDYNIGYDITPSQRLTQLSVEAPEGVEPSLGSYEAWVFLDPESIPWITVNNRVSYYMPENEIGIVKEGVTRPENYSELVTAGNYLVQYLSGVDDTKLYSIVDSLALLNEIFGEAR